MENSFGAIFDKIPCTIAHGLRSDFQKLACFLKCS